MATVTSIASGTWIAQAATVWDTGAIPEPGDNALLSAHTVTVDGTVTITNLAANNTAVLVFGAHIFNASGAIWLGNIEATAAAATIATPDFIINGAVGRGKLTLTDDLTLNGDFELAGGELDMGFNDMSIDGSIVYTAGTLSNPGTIIQGGTSTLQWYTSSCFDYILAAGAVVSLVTDFVAYVKSFTSPVGTILKSPEGKWLAVYGGSGAWWAAEGSVTADVRIYDCTSGPGNDINLDDADLQFYTPGTNTMTMDANIDIGTGTLKLGGSGAGDTQTLTMDGYTVTCAALRVGQTFTPKVGNAILNLGAGTHSIGSIAGGHADNDTNTLALDTCTINDMVAGIDGTLIDTVTVTDADVYANGDSIIKNLEPPSGTLTCHDCVDGGGNNENVVFVQSGRYRVYTGATLGTIDYTTPAAEVFAGIRSATIAGLGLTSGGEVYFGVRAFSQAGVEETNTTRVGRAVVSGGGVLLGGPPGTITDATATAIAEGVVKVDLSYVAVSGLPTGQAGATVTVQIARVVPGTGINWGNILATVSVAAAGATEATATLATPFSDGETVHLAGRPITDDGITGSVFHLAAVVADDQPPPDVSRITLEAAE